MSVATTDSKHSEKGNVARIIDRLSKDITSSNTTFLAANKVDVLLRKNRDQLCKNRFVVRFSYSSQQQDELDLKEGDEIEFIENIEDGWARGVIIQSSEEASKGKSGLYPTNFVSEMDTLTTPTTTTSLAMPRSTLETNDSFQPAKNGADGIVETNNVLPSSLKNSRRTMSTVITSSNEPFVPLLNVPPVPPKQKETAKVLFKYESANPDELSLPEGAVVTVLKKDCEDEGWYYGEFGGQRGLFPENFVKLIQNESPLSDKVHTVTNPPPSLPAKPFKFSRSSNLSGRSNLDRETVTKSTVESQNANDATKPIQLSTNPTITKPIPNHEERKSMSIVAGLQNKLFSSGKIPMQRPPNMQQKFGTSPEGADVLAEPKVSFNDATTAKLSSLVKHRATIPSRRLPSKNGGKSAVSIDDDSKIVSPPSPSLLNNNVISKMQAETSSISVKETLSPVIKLETSYNETNFSTASEVDNETEFITIAHFKAYKEEVNRKFQDLYKIIDEMRNKK